MKVLMTVDAVGGVWTYAVELAAALAPHGVQLVLAVLGPPPSDAQRTDARRAGNVELVELGGRLEWMDAPWADVGRHGAALLGLAADVGADLVHVNGYAHAALPWRRPVLVVAHSCVVTWWRAVHGTDPPEPWDEYRARVRRGLAAADAVVAPTRAFLVRLEAAHGPVARGRVIHNALQAVPAVRRPTIAREPTVLAAGRVWDASKGLETLDAAARGLSWRVEVAGPAASPDGVRVRADHLRALGALEKRRLHERMREVAVFVHPALYEPFGLAPLEAARAGCALVLSDLPELRELWDGAAAFAAPGDAPALHAALQAVLADDARRRALAEAAWHRSRDFDAARMAQEYLGTYRELRASGHRRTAAA